MPLLKRKAFPLLDPPTFDPQVKDRQVWVSPITSEIFTDYETYVKRYSLYRQRLWQCEVTGRSGLTFREALESERTETDRVKEKLPDELQKRVLQRAQFQTGRLDGVVDDVHDYYIDRFDSGDIVTCRWTDGVKYNARVLRVVSDNVQLNHNGPKANGKVTNGVSTQHAITNGQISDPRFLVELLDDDNTGLDDTQTIVEKETLKRDRLDFSKNLLKKFLRENLKKESYNGAPWVVKASIAEKFGIETKLPKHLQEIKDKVDAKSRRRRLRDAPPLGVSADSSDNPFAKDKLKLKGTSQQQQQKDKQSSQVHHSKLDPKKVAIEDARRMEAAIKYPIEDLDIPAYRRQPSGEGPIIDMKPDANNNNKKGSTIPNPTGGMPLCPTPSQQQSVPSDTLGSLLMVWTFLSVFAKSLGLYPFPLDDFESALRHTSNDFKSDILIESNVCLLNAIIKERQKSKSSSAAASASMTLSVNSNTHLSAPSSLRGTPAPSPSRQASVVVSEDDTEETEVITSEGDQQVFGAVWTNPHIYEIGRAWDAKLIPLGNDREGWEDILIGCIHDITPPAKASQIDSIFNSLVPDEDSTLEEREEAYLRLSLKEKVFMLEMLVGIVNQCAFIKEFMEECQDQMTELRKQKIDLSRERKRIHAERQELERRIEESERENESDSELSESGGETGDEENIDRTPPQQDSSSSATSSRSESRQALLKRKQMEREEREAKRIKLYHQQREEARARSQILKARSMARRKLDEEERQLHKKEEQMEHNMRRYNTLRIRPLGRDKFYNRYLYLDNIGGGATHGAGRLFVQSPSDVDFTLLRERNDATTYTGSSSSYASNNSTTTTITPPCGHGGGVSFVSALMQAQGFNKEAEFMEKRIQSMQDMESNRAATTLQPEEWWRCYDNPEDIDNLLAWLNPKGEREHKLKKELHKQQHNLMLGMKKRITEHNNASKQEATRRTTRKSTTNGPVGSWQAYVNKFAK
ncbi:ATP-utilizing chromatin assembly and remodelling N-terminal-domain-containing protein [Phascolomyces articulosus]|uniref:ATP-utilizing chromatin assembly and remodelling N-terminal-domain-containing protein n=1 Tax=Phascolomyces articulosus TaxID=60185 RepID=A0AAD5K246_9FUNG|nr:ATP-utilizing chromatin assembly and remodelling N-terminal-domain-containing protein [Phascolomyces articulosus]